MTGAGAALGRYRLLEPVGRGAHGIVYRADDPFRGQEVALKVYRAPPGADGEARVRLFETLFFNETRAAGMLSHPNIVRVFDAGRTGDDFYIAMEYVAGSRSLASHIGGGRLLDSERVAEVVFRCAEALDYAHRKGIVHRDVKPANILVQDDFTVKVTDFSIAELADPSSADTQLILSAGSPLYMSPEQLADEGATPQSDLFALGVVLYELLTGHHPFYAESLAAITARITSETPRPLDRFRTDLPDGVQYIVDRCLARSRTSRYATALELAADLSHIFGALNSPQDGIRTEDRARALRRHGFFEAFPDAEIWELLRWANWEEYPAGAPILGEGEAGDLFYIVVEGEVDVIKGDRVVRRLGGGELFGEMAYFSHQTRSATVRAAGPVTALSVNAARMQMASPRCQIAFQRVFIETLIERLRQTTAELARHADGTRDAARRPSGQ